MKETQKALKAALVAESESRRIVDAMSGDDRIVKVVAELRARNLSWREILRRIKVLKRLINRG